MKQIRLIIFSLTAASFFITSATWACKECSQPPTFQQQCALSYVKAGYSGTSFADSCAPIKSATALKCIQAFINNNYTTSVKTAEECSTATTCGLVAIEALTRNLYDITSYGFIKTVASVKNCPQALCMKEVFNQQYSNLTAKNIFDLCP